MAESAAGRARPPPVSHLAKLFAAAYAPYLLPPIVLILLLLASPMLLRRPFLSAAAFLAALPTVLLLLWKSAARPVYLVDFASFKSLDKFKMDPRFSAQVTRASNKCTPRNMLFQLKVLLKSGLGDDVYGPPFVFAPDDRRNPTLAAAIDETDLMMFGAVDQLLLKTGISASDIDILIVNVSMFYPSPSLSSRIVNRFKMREDVRTFNISGMGCAAGMVAVDLAQSMLRHHHRRNDKYAVVVGTENMTLNWYFGNDKSMLVPNCLFRCGSYALLLSNRPSDRSRSKLQLVKTVRTTAAASDRSYSVIVTREDDDGVVGTALSVDLLKVASEALTVNMTELVPEFMPLTELAKAAADAVKRGIRGRKSAAAAAGGGNSKPYVPDFKKAFDHFCLHPGGKAVVEGIAKNLGLSEYDVEPAKMTLYRFGNTSSSGLWYAMAYCEAKGRLKKGDKVWQVALGSGFKCNSVVWRVLRDVPPPVATPDFNPWMDSIDKYPVNVPDALDSSHPYYEFYKEMEGEVIRFEEQQRLLQQSQAAADTTTS